MFILPSLPQPGFPAYHILYFVYRDKHLFFPHLGTIPILVECSMEMVKIYEVEIPTTAHTLATVVPLCKNSEV